MSADMAGVSRIDFLRGRATVSPSDIPPDEWITLIDDATEGTHFEDIGRMRALSELIINMPKVIGGCAHEVAPGAYTRGKVLAPPGKRFLDCGMLSRGPHDTPFTTTSLLFGKASRVKKGERRIWSLYTLWVDWVQPPKQAKDGIVLASRIELAEMEEDALRALFTVDSQVAFAARTVLHHLHLALGDTAKELEKRTRRVARRRTAIAAALERTGYMPFLASTRLSAFR